MVMASTFFYTQHGLIMLINFAGHELLLWVSCFFPIEEALGKAHAFFMILKFAEQNYNYFFHVFFLHFRKLGTKIYKNQMPTIMSCLFKKNIINAIFLKDSMLLLTNHTLVMIRNFAGPNNNCLFYPLSRFQKLQNFVIRHFDLINAICGWLAYLLRNTLDMMRNYARPILRRCRYFSLFNRLKERNLKLRHFHETSISFQTQHTL